MVVRSTERKAVDRYLADGTTGKMSPEELADVCNRVIREETHVSTVSSVALARRFVQQAKKSGGVLYLTALRAYGWALLAAHKYSEAERTYLEARSLARPDPLLRARIDRILIDIYMYLGKPAEVRRRADLALRTFRKLGADDEIAKTRVNCANVLHRQDRHREAHRLYGKAADHFQSQNNQVAAAVCRYNLANTCVQLFDFSEAARHYVQAREIFSAHKQHLYATDCLNGLAWLHMLEGNFHLALRELTECEAFFSNGKQTRQEILCQLDHAETYLSLNLIIDAVKSAEKAGKAAQKLGIAYEFAKAELFRGKALAALGRRAAARKCLIRAENAFRKEGNEGFIAVAQLALAQLEHHGQQKLQHIRSARKKFARAQLPLWEAICDLQIISDWPEETAPLRRLAASKAVTTVPHMSAHRHTILGDRYARKNQMNAAVSHWATAADILDAVRAKLPPIEMRSAFFSTRTEPHRKLIQAEYRKNPLRAAAWSERYKTVGLWSTSSDFFMANPTRRKIKDNLSYLAQYVTGISRAITNSRGKRTVGLKNSATLRRLHCEIRSDLARLEHGASETDRGADISDLIQQTSRSLPIVQFHVGETDILAFVHQHGTSRAWRFSDGRRILSEMVARWRFVVECAPAPSKRPRLSHVQDEQQILSKISNWLLPPLKISNKHAQLLLVPEGQLSSLPWMALPVNGQVLGEKYQMVFAPSLRHHLHAAQQKTKSKKIRILVGASSGLPHLRQEVAAISARLGISENDVVDNCRRSDWPDYSQARIWHFAGHAHLRADNPFYSSLILHDGPLFAADFRLKRNRVNLVTLAACRTGQQTSLPGEEASGLVRSLLEMGAANVVASNWAVSDRATAMWMDLFYKYYLSGSTTAASAREASMTVRESFPLACHWGSFAVHGTG